MFQSWCGTDAKGKHRIRRRIGGHLFDANGLYLEDVCWSPHFTCTLQLTAAPQGHPHRWLTLPAFKSVTPGRPLCRRHYGVVLGPAAAIGAGSAINFATLLEDQLGMPFVNLGKGGVGPGYYLHAWPLIGPMLREASLVLIVVMSGRSSSNSQNAWMHSTSSTAKGGREQACFQHGKTETLEKWRKYDYDANGPGLIDESLRTARCEYEELFRRIRAPPSAGRTNVVLVFMASADFADPTVKRDEMEGAPTFGFPVWINRSFVAGLSLSQSVPFVQVDFGEALRKIDKCRTAAGSGGYHHDGATCDPDTARQDFIESTGSELLLACYPRFKNHNKAWSASSDADATNTTRPLRVGKKCNGVVRDSYYPSTLAHHEVAAALLPLIAAACRTTARTRPHLNRVTTTTRGTSTKDECLDLGEPFTQ